MLQFKCGHVGTGGAVGGGEVEVVVKNGVVVEVLVVVVVDVLAVEETGGEVDRVDVLMVEVVIFVDFLISY
jgi:hypothetical protein